MIPTLLVDDEPLARKRMRSLLRSFDDFTVVAEAEDGETALREIAERRPRVVFLDVEMPDLDGFEVVRRLDGVVPLIVFVTAYEHYALDAFRASAVQYLLKPVDPEELKNAVARVRTLASAYLDRVAVKLRGRTYLVRTAQIDRIESAGNYVRLHAGDEHYLLRETMAGIEEKLDPQQFVRIHRTAIVNLERVQELLPETHGDATVVLRDGTRLTLSRIFRDRILPLMGKL